MYTFLLFNTYDIWCTVQQSSQAQSSTIFISGIHHSSLHLHHHTVLYSAISQFSINNGRDFTFNFCSVGGVSLRRLQSKQQKYVSNEAEAFVVVVAFGCIFAIWPNVDTQILRGSSSDRINSDNTLTIRSASGRCAPTSLNLIETPPSIILYL